MPMHKPQNLPANPTTQSAPVAVPHSPPSWLEAWRPAHRISNQTPETVRAELVKWEPAIIPASPKQVAILLEQTLELYGAPTNWSETAMFYMEALEDVPLDLIETALKHVRLTLKWFPKPCELREPISDELARRKLTASRLRMMLDHGKFVEPRVGTNSPEDREKMLAKMGEVIRDLKHQTDTPDAPKRRAS